MRHNIGCSYVPRLILIKHGFAGCSYCLVLFFYSFSFARSLPTIASMIYILAPTLAVRSTGNGAGRGGGGGGLLAVGGAAVGP